MTIALGTDLPTLDPPSCVSDDGSLCATVYRVTGSNWLAGSADWLIAKPAKILLIVVLALLVRWLVNRAIGRLTRGTANASVPGVLRPLREHAPAALLDASPLLPERRRQRAEAVGSVLRSITTVVVFVVATMLVLGELGIDLAPLLASAGIVGVAIGFGAQNLVKDFLSGIFMILEDQYGVGDVVDVGDVVGTVEAVGLRTTRIRDVAGAMWYVRNGEILRVANKSQGWSRVVVDVPLSYLTDTGRASAVLADVAQQVCAGPELAGWVLDPPVVTGVESLTSQGLTLRVMVTVRPDGRDPVARAIRATVRDRFAAEGFAPPYPPGTMVPGPDPGRQSPDPGRTETSP